MAIVTYETLSISRQTRLAASTSGRVETSKLAFRAELLLAIRMRYCEPASVASLTIVYSSWVTGSPATTEHKRARSRVRGLENRFWTVSQVRDQTVAGIVQS
jgi:hypothetical protein